jgi:HlyD family secretion protein
VGRKCGEEFNMIVGRKAILFAHALILFCILLPGCAKGDGDVDSTAAPTEKEEAFSIEAFGVVKVMRERTIAIEFPATIQKIHVTTGQKVTKGTTLVTLDIGPYKDQQAGLRHRLRVARLQLDQLDADHVRSDATASSEYRRLENSLASAQREVDQLTDEYEELRLSISSGDEPEMNKLRVNLDQARKELLVAEDDLALRNALYKDGSVSEKELEQELHAVEALRSQAKNLALSVESLGNRQRQELSRLQLLVSQKTVGVDNLRIQAEQLAGPEITTIEIQKAQIEAYELEMDQLLAKSLRPFVMDSHIVCDVENGIFYEITKTEGEPVTLGIPLVRILDLDSLVVEALVPEEFIKEIALGDTATITPLADPDRAYAGQVTHIAGMANSRNGETSVNVTLEVLDHDGFLVPYFNVDIEFTPTQENDSD